MRTAGAATVYFDLNLKNRVGTTTAPANPSLIPGRVKTFFAFAQQQTGCATPLIVLNELSGPGLVTPWSDNNAQYRADILAFVQGLAALGAHPVLLLPSKPYTGGDAGVWWQQAAQSAELVREIYVPAPSTWKLGPVLGNRTLRMDYRQAAADLLAIGVPPSRIGLMLGFQTDERAGRPRGARAGFGVVPGGEVAVARRAAGGGRAEAADRVVVGLGDVLAGAAEHGSGQAGHRVRLPVGAVAGAVRRAESGCRRRLRHVPHRGPARASSERRARSGRRHADDLDSMATISLAQVTGDRETAYSALYERLVESARCTVATTGQVLAAERAVIALRFRGSRALYRAALAARPCESHGGARR